MINPSRRSLLRGSLAIAAAGTLARPYIANAAAKTATVWWVQGFAQEEDVSIKKIFADYEKASGNTIDYSIVPYAPHRQKVISAMTSGEVPDLFPANPAEVASLFAWQGKLTDVSDVVETQKSAIQRDRACCPRSAITTIPNNAAFTACRLPVPRCRSTSGARWSRRRATSCRTRPRPGTPFGTSSSRCRTSCARRACAASMPSVCRSRRTASIRTTRSTIS